MGSISVTHLPRWYDSVYVREGPDAVSVHGEGTTAGPGTGTLGRLDSSAVEKIDNLITHVRILNATCRAETHFQNIPIELPIPIPPI